MQLDYIEFSLSIHDSDQAYSLRVRNQITCRKIGV